MNSLYIALIHYPVLRNGSVITSSITNLDIHDISRVTATYGLGGYFIVHPDKKMRLIASQLAKHWVSGYGKEVNPDRSKALRKTMIVSCLKNVTDIIFQKTGYNPLIVGTTARKNNKTVNVKELKELKKKKKLPLLILFGTAGGIEDKTLNSLDYILKPIETETGYNHLSVRSAVAIFIDRLFLCD